MPPRLPAKHCLKCASNTEHKLVPCEKGVALECVICGNQQEGYTFGEMYYKMMKHIFKVPDKAKEITPPENIRVFLKHEGPDNKESELDREAILVHIKIMGELPKVGKPVFASVSETPVPYGTVSRVELGDG